METLIEWVLSNLGNLFNELLIAVIVGPIGYLFGRQHEKRAWVTKQSAKAGDGSVQIQSVDN